MVSVHLFIVDVAVALHNKSHGLHCIRQKHPFIAQLFHFRKSHHVHLVGAAVTQRALMNAIDDVFALCGEPFLMSPLDSDILAQLVFVVGADSIEQDVVHLFQENERFARDDQVRSGWRIAGPVYGVCAATHERRRGLMQSCLSVINAKHNRQREAQSTIDIAVSANGGRSICSEGGAHCALSTSAAAAAGTIPQSVDMGGSRKTHRKSFAIADLPTNACSDTSSPSHNHTLTQENPPTQLPASSPNCLCPLADPSTSAPKWGLTSNHNTNPTLLTNKQTTVTTSRAATSVMSSGDDESVADCNKSSNTSSPTPPEEGHTSSTCIVRQQGANDNPEGDDGTEGGDDPLAPLVMMTLPHASSSLMVCVANSSNIGPFPAAPMELSAANLLSTAGHCPRKQFMLFKQHQGSLQSTAVFDDVDRVCSQLHLRFEVQEQLFMQTMEVFEVTLTCCCRAPQLKPCDSVDRLALAEDMIRSRCGVGPLTIRVKHPTSRQRCSLFSSTTFRPAMVDQQRTSSSSPVKTPFSRGRPSLYSKVEKAIETMCGAILQRGEIVEVVRVACCSCDENDHHPNSSSLVDTSSSAIIARPLPVHHNVRDVLIHCVVHGIKGRGVARRAADIQSFVAECLNNVQELNLLSDDGDDQFDDVDDERDKALVGGLRVSSAFLAALANINNVFVVCRTLLEDYGDTVASVVIMGLQSSVLTFFHDMSSLTRTMSSTQ
ncbi:Hypothetical protein, putative [Bodo saltans]|uniref:Uncharacterized protein n=1 Tax=Bodo saltans TaxID=75058 RepID=A0A0S4IZB0_BODSA|nr:Hypothetical protein, putative [Bodo saltans]|eukprot:CUG19797.1 Hypothetical protein, putative [Bodo saltans]